MTFFKVGSGHLTQSGNGIKLLIGSETFYLISKQVDDLLEGKIDNIVVSITGGEDPASE